MAKAWSELGNGRYKLTITDDDNPDAPPSVYRGSKDEIADMLADSQFNANRRIAELKRKPVHFGEVAGDHPNGSSAHPLTPNERMQTVAELQNPATVDTAFSRLHQAATGESPEEAAERRQREEMERFNERATNVAVEFAANTPEYAQTPHNANTMVGYMRTHGMDLTNPDHYRQAFEALSAAQLLQTMAPGADNQDEVEEDTTLERNAPAPKAPPKPPTRIATGISSRDISGTPPRPTVRLKYSREQLDNMSPQQYKQLMLTDRTELEKCETYYAKRPAQRAS
jgi:hypothetical protein